MYLAPGTRIVRDGVRAVLIVYGVVLYELRAPLGRRPLMPWLGDASYSLYLSHAIVLSALFQIVRAVVGLDSPVAIAAYLAVALVAVTVASIALYEGFEKPVIKLFRTRTRATA